MNFCLILDFTHFFIDLTLKMTLKCRTKSGSRPSPFFHPITSLSSMDASY